MAWTKHRTSWGGARDSGLALLPPSRAMYQTRLILPSWQALGREDSSSTLFFHWAPLVLFSPQILTSKPKPSTRPHHTWQAQPYRQLQEIGQEKEIQGGGNRTPLIQNRRQGQVLILLTGKSWGILSSLLSLIAGERRKWNDQKVAYEWLLIFESKQSLFILLPATLGSKVSILGLPAINCHKLRD